MKAHWRIMPTFILMLLLVGIGHQQPPIIRQHPTRLLPPTAGAKLNGLGTTKPAAHSTRALWQTERGLPQGTVTCMIQDRFGYMWFGTQDGLARYDGYNFMIFRHDSQDSTTLSNSAIYCLCEDRLGTLWVGTSGGLNRFHRATGKFIRYEYYTNKTTGLSNNSVRTLLADSSVLWVGTNSGLNRFDIVAETFTHYEHNPDDTSSLSHNEVRSLLKDPSSPDALWVGTNGGLNHFNRSIGKFVRYQHSPADANSLSHNSVMALLYDRLGMLWIGTAGGGLNRFDRASRKFTRYQHNPADEGSLSHNEVRTLLEDRSPSSITLWVGTNGGLNRFDCASGKSLRYMHNPRDSTSLNYNEIRSLLEDRGGTLWVGTAGGGLNRSDLAAGKFTRYQYNSADQTSLGGNLVRALLEDRKGTLWIGIRGAGLNRFDRSTGKFTHYQHNPADRTSLSDNRVYSLLEDRSGALWIGTVGGGLNHFDRATGKFTRYKHNPKDATSLSNNDVWSLLEDRAGTLWVGTDGGGLNHFDHATGKFTRYQYNPADATSLSHNDVLALLEDRTGTFWVGTVNGLNRFDRSSGKFTRYLRNPADAASLSNNGIYSLMEDHTGTLWVGTWGGGLNCFDRTTGKFTVFSEKDGLPNDTINGIIEDEDGNLWLSTNKGLCKFNPRTKTVANYDKRDGLQDNEFTMGAYHRGQSGRIYFGGVGGFNDFFSADIRTDTVPPPVLITMFKKFNRSAPLDSAIEEKKIILLPHSDNVIGFEFAAMSFHIADRNLYSYKLEGFDTEWSPVGTKREATYTNLDPGEFVFRVKASNSDGLWNEQGASIRVIIAPPWWAWWWVRTVFALCVVGGLYQTYHWRVRTLARQNEQLEQQVRGRTEELSNANIEIRRQLEMQAEQARKIEEANAQLQDKNIVLEQLDKEKNESMKELESFSYSVAHDLRTPLRAISSFSQILFEDYHERLDDEGHRVVDIITKNAVKMSALIDGLLAVSRMGRAGLKPAMLEMTEVVREVLEEIRQNDDLKEYIIELEDLPEAFCDAVLIKQVWINLLSNAIKYSRNAAEKRITIGSLVQNGTTVYFVRDRGAGFDMRYAEKLFQVFQRLHKETEFEGTGVGLTIVHRVISKHGGTVWAEAEINKGSTFYFTLSTSTTTPIKS